MKLWTLIVQPQAFFRQLYDQPTHLWLPLGIVLSSGWLRYIAFLIWTRNLPSIFPAEWFQSMDIGAGGPPNWIGLGLLGLLCWPFIGWGVCGWIIQILTRCRCRAWQLAGWTYLPITMMGLIMVGIAGVWPATGRVIPYSEFFALRPEEPALSQYLTWLELYSHVLQGQAFFKLMFWLVLLGSLWSLWLLYCGVRGLAPRKAVLTTSVLTILVVIWRVL